MLAPLMNRMKACIQNPLKNSNLAKQIEPTLFLIAEHLLPFYLQKHKAAYKKIKTIHNVCFLLVKKVQGVFLAPVISTCMDNLWDLRGLSEVLNRAMSMLGLNQRHIHTVNKFIKNNLDIKQDRIARFFAKNTFKKIFMDNNDEDLLELTDTFICTKEFLQEEIASLKAGGCSGNHLT